MSEGIAIAPPDGLAEPEVATLVDALPADEIAPYDWLLREGPALAARVGNEVAGLGVLARDDLHPQRRWAAVLVAPEFRRRGIGTALHQALVELSPLPLKARVYPSATAARQFVASLWLRLLVRSHLVQLDGVESLEGVKTALPAGVRIEPVDEPLTSDIRARVAALYARIHAWDPPAPGSHREISDRLCANVAVAFVARRQDAIVGIGLAHRSERGPFLEAAMVGTVEPDEHGAPVTAALLAAIRQRAEAVEVEVEVDEGEGAHDELLEIVRDISPPPWPEPTLVVTTD